MPRHIVIVEDEEAIRENYTDILRRQGYRVSGYAGRQDALNAFRSAIPDLAILDIGLDDEAEGGFDLCRELRAMSSSVPIIFLTARDSDLDAVSGLRLGADDYLTKNISIPQLTARRAALFRRVEAMRRPSDETALLKRGDLAVDKDRLRVYWLGQPVDLTLTEFWMVHALARYPGHVKTRDQLMQAANILVDTATISTHIKRIRHKFALLDPGFNAIEAVYAVGYRWVSDVG